MALSSSAIPDESTKETASRSMTIARTEERRGGIELAGELDAQCQVEFAGHGDDREVVEHAWRP
jgi:hypothetical protein